MSDNESLGQHITDALLADKKVERRWRNIRFFVWIIIILTFFGMAYHPKDKSADAKKAVDYVTMVRMQGVIMPGSSFSSEKMVPLLQGAFADKQAKGVVIVINSPGGSPVQASIIHDKIVYLKNKYKKKVVVVGEDALASGAYLVATAADDIYVNNDTLTGSIGVIMSSFGFTDVMSKVGVERRVYTAGENKDRLDPFKPVTKADKAKIQTVLNDVHQSFIQDVLKGREGRLKEEPKKLFTGDFWSGSEAVKLGLVDGTANLWTVLKKEYNVEYYRELTPHKTLLQHVLQDLNTELKLNLGTDLQSPKLQAVLEDR